MAFVIIYACLAGALNVVTDSVLWRRPEKLSDAARILSFVFGGAILPMKLLMLVTLGPAAILAEALEPHIRKALASPAEAESKPEG